MTTSNRPGVAVALLQTCLVNSDVAQVSNVTWSQNFIFLGRCSVSGLPKDLKMHAIQVIHIFFRFARNQNSSKENLILWPLYNGYYCHITII